jgi:hypothetical protein
VAGHRCYHCKQWVEAGEAHDCWILGRAIKAPQVRRVDRSSKSKLVHFVQIRHRDEVEPPITEWLREAYDLCDVLTARTRAKPARTTAARKSKRR